MYRNLSAIVTDPLGLFVPVPFVSSASVQLSNALLFSLVFCFLFALATRRILRWKGAYNIALRALRHGGPIPKHVAFIMDGNRRWARRLGLPPSEGHPKGGEKLIESLQWCLEAGIETVTVFAFSIENFKRSESEVSEIMSLAERTFNRFMNRNHILHERRVRVRFLGDLSFISPPLRKLMARLMLESVQYTDGPTLNICFAYAARYDIANAITDVANCCRRSNTAQMRPDDIDANVIAAFLASGGAKGAGDPNTFFHHSYYPDLLVRTSGETRLSDFLIWESSQCILSFYPALWPELSVWDFVKIVLQYQRNFRSRNIHYASLLKKSLTDGCLRSTEANKNSEKICRLRDVIGKCRQAHNKSITSYYSS